MSYFNVPVKHVVYMNYLLNMHLQIIFTYVCVCVCVCVYF